MPCIIEKTDGTMSYTEGGVESVTLTEEIVAIHEIAKSHRRQMSFVTQSFEKKIERRIKMPDGTLKTKAEMTQEELEAYSARRRQLLAANKAKGKAKNGK